jgi:DNA polymerase (family 10)
MEIKGENRFKVLAYRRAAENITALGRDINDIQQAGELSDIPGIGQAIHDKIEELLTTGQMSFWEKLSAEVPPSLSELLEINGMGPKTVKLLWQELGVTSMAQLKEVAEAGQLSQLPGLGKKTETNILAGIAALARRETDRFRLDVAYETAMGIIDVLRELPAVQRIEPAGSLRRFAPTIGDLDILVATEQPEPIMEAFRQLPNVEAVLGSGPTKTSIRFLNGLQADLRCLEPQHWGAALQYFSGSRAHNVRIREMAQRRKLSLNEYSYTREDGTEILCTDEAEVYAVLELPYIPPVLREDRGEIEAAQAGKLPKLIEIEDIRGEVHCHSTWSDGQGSIEEMARAALARGYEYLVISDHSQSLGIANGLTPGAKPEKVCNWVLDLLNFLPGDECADMVPGTGIMGRVSGERGRE